MNLWHGLNLLGGVKSGQRNASIAIAQITNTKRKGIALIAIRVGEWLISLPVAFHHVRDVPILRDIVDCIMEDYIRWEMFKRICQSRIDEEKGIQNGGEAKYGSAIESSFIAQIILARAMVMHMFIGIALSWKNILAVICALMKSFIIKMAFKMMIESRIWKSCLNLNTRAFISRNQRENGPLAGTNAKTAERLLIRTKPMVYANRAINEIKIGGHFESVCN